MRQIQNSSAIFLCVSWVVVMSGTTPLSPLPSHLCHYPISSDEIPSQKRYTIYTYVLRRPRLYGGVICCAFQFVIVIAFYIHLYIHLYSADSMNFSTSTSVYFCILGHGTIWATFSLCLHIWQMPLDWHPKHPDSSVRCTLALNFTKEIR